MAASKDMAPLTNFGRVFWQNQFRTKIELPDPTRLPKLEEKVAIITGSNTGLGLEAAKQLLALGLSHLILAVRSIEKGDTAADFLRKLSPKARIEVWKLDMESYRSIQDFVSKCATDLPRIDYVVLNAGLAPVNFAKVDSTGHETAIQVNHFSTALLTILLLPILKSKSSPDTPSRLTTVNSLTAHLCKFSNRKQRPLLASFDDTAIVPWDPQERYGVSKLLNQLFLVKLAGLVNSRTVTINMVDPGLTSGTGLSRDTTGIVRVLAGLFIRICGRPVDRAAATYVYALLEKGPESHGCFLMSNNIAPLANIFYTDEGKAVAEQIWKETLDELEFAKAKEIVASLP